MPCISSRLLDHCPLSLTTLDDSVLLQVSLAAQAKGPKLHGRQEKAQVTRLEDIPDEVILSLIHRNFGARDSCSLSQVSSKYSNLASSDTHWEILYQQVFGEANNVTREAAKLAKSWKKLFRCKTVSDKQAEPWLTPCEYELTAVLQRITAEQENAHTTGGILFLLDGSGSVSPDDFAAMTGFVFKSVKAICAVVPTCKIGVMQFSNDVHVEVPLGAHEEESFGKAMTDMVRMNGGTSVAMAIQTASKHMQSNLPEAGRRTLILLTDGRIDDNQGKEAIAMARQWADAQADVSIYAFGVGCGVDRTELDKIVAACGCTDPDCRYMALAVHPESLW